ncbi:MAG: hypothetical protein ABI281_14600, partial [Caldimonas sp.]
VCNSVFDRDSAAECHAELMALPRAASGRCKVAAIGMRIDGRTRGAGVLAGWASALKLPYIGTLRETQAYVRCIEQGLTLFDLPPARSESDRAEWRPIVEWLDAALRELPRPALAARVVVTAPALLPRIHRDELATLARRHASPRWPGLLGWLGTFQAAFRRPGMRA